MSQETAGNARCSQCAPILIEYLDQSIDADMKISVLAELLLRSQSEYGPDDNGKLLSEIGHSLDDYLQRKCVREHVFLGRSLAACRLSEPELQSELHRLRDYLNAAI